MQHENRAYSVLQVKAVEEDGHERILRGVATVPAADRVGDVVDPEGVSFRNPLPLLWMHKHDMPVGTVRFNKPTKDGVTFEARFAKPERSETLKARVDEAFESVRLGLVTGVSIGFRSLEHAILKTGGYHFLKTEVYELSLVTIPANAGAVITAIKSVDSAALASAGVTHDGVQSAAESLGANKRGPVVLQPRRKPHTITVTPKRNPS